MLDASAICVLLFSLVLAVVVSSALANLQALHTALAVSRMCLGSYNQRVLMRRRC
jgi:hypothetical protein